MPENTSKGYPDWGILIESHSPQGRVQNGVSETVCGSETHRSMEV